MGEHLARWGKFKLARDVKLYHYKSLEASRTQGEGHKKKRKCNVETHGASSGTNSVAAGVTTKDG